jgi:hypothetical protein
LSGAKSGVGRSRVSLALNPGYRLQLKRIKEIKKTTF